MIRGNKDIRLVGGDASGDCYSDLPGKLSEKLFEGKSIQGELEWKNGYKIMCPLPLALSRSTAVHIV